MSAAGSYQLGVDLGTTYTAAAVARDGQCRMVGLGNRSSAIPSVVHVAADGTVRAGDAADRRAPSEPDRVAREFKRRVGDPTPLLLGGTPYSAEALLGTLLDAVVSRVSALEGAPPSHLTVTHPANWGPYKHELFDHCLRVADVASTSTVTEPEAAAISYAANERVEPGSLVAVYDLGGGTFDVAVLRKTADGFSILGRPEGIERLGGIDFDEAVVGHVRGALRGELDDVDVDDPAVMTALVRLRRDCIEAKEALSSDSEVVVPVLLPGAQTEVRLTRAEFERMIRPTLDSTIDAMRRALVAAAVEPRQISAVLLVGGSSRIPLVAELVSRAFERPVAVDAHPKHAVALGAARAAALVAVAGDAGQPRGDARVLPFVAPRSTEREPRTVAVAGAHSPSVDASSQPGPAPAGERRQRQWDRRPYDDEPVEVPTWLVGARGGRPSRSRVWTGLIAFLLLSALTIGAGAFITADPPSEARGDTPVVHGSPATEWAGDQRGADDAAPDDAAIDDADLSEAQADMGGKLPADGGTAIGRADGDGGSGSGSDGASDGAAADDQGIAPPTRAERASGDDRGTQPGATEPGGTAPTPEPGPADPPSDPDPATEPPTDSPSGPADAGGGGQDPGATERPTDLGSTAPSVGTPTQS